MVKKIVCIFSLLAMLWGFVGVVQSRTLGSEPFSYRVIMLNDNLWRISREVMPEHGVSRNQIMFAILRKNPDAFRGGNINYLRTGVELVMPTLAEAQAEIPEQVNTLVTTHKTTWSEGKVSAPALYLLPGMANPTLALTASQRSASEAATRTAPALATAPESPPLLSKPSRATPPEHPPQPAALAPPPTIGTTTPHSGFDRSTRAASASAASGVPAESTAEQSASDRRPPSAMPATLGWLAMGAVAIFAFYSFSRSRPITRLQLKRGPGEGKPSRGPVPLVDLAKVLPSIEPVGELVVRQGAIGFAKQVADAREVEIKLRIAKAYVDVGRTRDARQILVEVGHDRHPEPRRVAGSQPGVRATYG
jgi:FimV-like protein